MPIPRERMKVLDRVAFAYLDARARKDKAGRECIANLFRRADAGEEDIADVIYGCAAEADKPFSPAEAAKSFNILMWRAGDPANYSRVPGGPMCADLIRSLANLSGLSPRDVRLMLFATLDGPAFVVGSFCYRLEDMTGLL